MNFLHPTYLWALLGLAVPIAIHLWSKKKVRTIKVGSIKFIKNTNPKQTNTIKINELWLLALRLLTLFLLVLISAGPQLKTNGLRNPITYLIEPSLLSNNKLKSILDSLPVSDLRLLKSGFPKWDENSTKIKNHPPLNYWHLAQEMSSIQSDSIVVFTKGLVSGIKGMRPVVHSNVHLIVIDSENTSYEDILEANLNGEQAQFLSVISDGKKLAFESRSIPLKNEQIEINQQKDSISILLNGTRKNFPIKTLKPLEVLLVYKDSLSGDVTYIEAAYRAVSKYLDREINLKKVSEASGESLLSFNSIVWLSEEPVPETEATVLAYKPDSLASKLIELSSFPNMYHITRPLTSENIINEHLAEHIIKSLDLYPEIDKEALLYDKRVVDVEELNPIQSNRKNTAGLFETTDISPWLWIALFFILIAERFFSKYRKQ
ncbi:hypothetical protein GGR42_000730 [Saonia flava]|uniref:Aerotolerance regulator N-terminal domain-containing protein n=1 Tax=Saonia flava TaxID=523696 RepID=A0A846QQ85_9FLAO|nr:BatA domain-containing protein [Saonia flava]NJB70268.1 hypothetical protein [Saonia flava]